MKAILEQRILLPALLLSPSLLAPSRGWAQQVPIAVRDLTLMGFLTSWNFRAEVMLVVAVLVVAYTYGWQRLRNRGYQGTARRWRPASYLAGLMVLGLALLFWWPIINPAPRVHGRIHPGHLTFHILYLTTAAAQTVALGALIALPQRVLYSFYAAAPRLWGLSPLNDQSLGGGIMWVAAHMYLLPILLVVARLLAEEERVEAGGGVRDAPQAHRDRAYERP